MAVKVKKVVKKHFGVGGSASKGREQSPLRPKNLEKKPPCADACPSGNRVRQFVTVITQAERLGKSLDQALEEAWYIYTDTSPFPVVCGRVCPGVCETQCNRKELEGAVNINKIERAIGDFGIAKNLQLKAITDQKAPQKIAVIGAGPSGLSCAYQLVRRGYGVTVFEALGSAGGMLRWGIPGYRLPENLLDAEIQKILDLGYQLAILGTGEPALEAVLRSHQTKLGTAKGGKADRGEFAAVLKFDEGAARRIYAGCDLFLIPSRFEPCGLTQMIAMRYGAVPVVRGVGGLKDTVIDISQKDPAASGFVFEDFSATALLEVLARAYQKYQSPGWGDLVQRCLQKDFSWQQSAAKYQKLYQLVLSA